MADDIQPLASLSLTHVYYNPSDPLSHLSAYLSLLPQALCVVYATLLWSTREAEVLLMFLGQLACEAVNFALKRLIKEERPRLVARHAAPGAGSDDDGAAAAARGAAVGHGYGMPSSHAQFAVFWAVAVSLFLLVRHRPRHAHAGAAASGRRFRRDHRPGDEKPAGGPSPGSSLGKTTSRGPPPPPTLASSLEAYAHSPWTLAERGAASVGVLALAALVAWSRVYLGYHTARQVVAGCAAGAGCAAAWFAVTYLLRETGALARALELPPARWLRIRDLVVEEDLCQAGWEKWEGRRRAALERERERQRAEQEEEEKEGEGGGKEREGKKVR